MNAFQVQGNTVTFTGAVAAPTAVQAVSFNETRAPQYLLTNIGSVPVFVGFSPLSAAAAGANAVIPTATPTTVYPLLPGTQIVFSGPPDAWFTGITSSGTAIVYVTPGYGD